MSLGIHIAKISKIRDAKYKTMLEAIEAETQLLNLSACQIFTSGPRSFTRNKMDYGAIKKYCRENHIKISSHGTYVSISIWKVNHANKSSADSKKFINHIIDMLKDVKSLGGIGVVLHLPKKSPEIIVETLEVLSENKEIEELQHNGGPYIILEMPASKPDNMTYETVEKLNNLCSMIKDSGASLKWCLCIDTSHQWSCGVKLNDLHVWHSWITGLTEYTRNKIKLIHLNGNNASNFGKGKDIHEIVMSPHDGIWHGIISNEMSEFIKRNGKEIIKEQNNFLDHLSESELKKIKESSLGAIIHYAKKHDIELILEVNRGEFIYTKFAVDIISGLLV